MAKEICISSTPHETRLAILEDDQLAEIYYERENEYTLAGSIYNGRVTRVLPGMQSAFVDLGLERDAFLYVTDFLELEDPEESDEIEKAATSGATLAPREVRAAVEPVQRPEPRSGQRAEGRIEQRPESRRDRTERPDHDRVGRERRPAPEPPLQIEPVETQQVELPSAPAPGEGEGDSDDPGSKRWRGRRRRRGSRGSTGPVADPVESETSAETFLEPLAHEQPAFAPDLHASSAEQHIQSEREAVVPLTREPRPVRESTPFVLPGESLSMYGGESAAATVAPSPVSATRPAVTFKPSTLIESPLEWDGSGLLPGESLARHRTREQEPLPAPVEAEPREWFEDASPGQLHPVLEEISEEAPPFGHDSGENMEPVYLTPAAQPFEGDDLVEEEYVPQEQHTETVPLAAAESTLPAIESDPFSDPFFSSPNEAHQSDPHGGQETPTHEKPEHDSTALPLIEATTAETHRQHPVAERPEQPHDLAEEEDRSASHHVDPVPPSEFRWFGLGGKKKSEDERSPDQSSNVAVAEPPGPAGGGAVHSFSAFAPGAGLVEEETIEEEEFDAPRGHHKGDEQDLDDYVEEEKLQTQIRSGELGEMLQVARLENRMQLEVDEKNGADYEEDFEDEDDDEEGTEEPVAPEGAAPAGQPRRDRGPRGRRGSRPPQGGRGDRRGGPPRRTAQATDLPIISDLLKPGQEILVQIAKEPIAKKGARITSHIALPGRFLVFMPTVSHIGVSRKIASDDERQRLKRILVSERGEASGGFIVRTAAEGASEEELRADLRFLLHLWDEIKERSEKSKSPALIYHDLSLIERILRDQVSANFTSIWVDSQDDYERIVRFLNRFSPNLVRRVKLYTKETPLFEHFGIQDEISKALRSKVWLKSGGSIVINQTEALVAIDINTGKYVGKTARLEDTIVKTNLDAIPEIVRQIRLRDLGGIIIIDFIDMDERKNRFKVMAALEEALKQDRAPTKVLQFNDFGLVAITRKRVKQSLERTLSVPCPTCQATGMVKSPTTVCNEIYIELRKMRKHFENADVVVRVHPETVKALKANNASWLTEFEELIGKNILVKSDPALHPEQFDIQG